MKLFDLTQLNYRAKWLIIAGIDLFLFISCMAFLTPTDFISYALLPVVITYPFIMLLLMMLGGSYRFSLRFFQWQSLFYIALNLVVAFIVIWLLEMQMKIWQLSLTEFFYYSALSISAVLISRMMLSVLLSYSDQKLPHAKINASIQSSNQLVIYGVNSISEMLIQSKAAQDKIIFLLDDDPSLHHRMVMGKRVLPPVEFFKYRQSKFSIFHPILLVQVKKVNQIIIALTQFDHQRIDHIINSALENHLTIRMTPNSSNINFKKNLWRQLENLSINSLLGRMAIQPDTELMKKSVVQKNVLITGAGGSIGSEISRQALIHGAKSIVLLEQSEYQLYKIDQSLKNLKKKQGLDLNIHTKLASVTDHQFLKIILKELKIDIVFHAAAYKHVPITQENPLKTFENNVWGTYQLLMALKSKPDIELVMISTDKAVEPANTMGLSKRISELLVQALSQQNNYRIVRFGNVLGSSGSVIPLFQKQINQGGPLTVTHPKMTRFFMTIEEATQLVIQSSSLQNTGKIFVLDMGKPVNIDQLAQRMVQISGLSVYSKKNPHGISIQYTGIRKGEKLHEKLYQKALEPTQHPKIFQANDPTMNWPELSTKIEILFDCMKQQKTEQMLEYAYQILPERLKK